MKIKLSKKFDEKINAPHSSILHSLLNFINQKSQASHSRTALISPNNTDIDEASDEITLHVDFSRSVKGSLHEKSSNIEIVIYIGDGPEYNVNSTPCIAFSFDDLIDEKIELLDASIVSENRVEVLERLALRLNDHAKQLKDALKRYHVNKKNISGKNSPLW